VAAARARALVFRLSSRWYGPNPANAELTWLGRERIAIGAVPTAESAYVQSVEEWLGSDHAVVHRQ
jgi:hypothetical protein